MPAKPEPHHNEDALMELKKQETLHSCIRPTLFFIENSSSYIRLVKIVSFVLRFLRGIRPYQVEPSAEEYKSALKAIVYDSNEYNMFKSNLNVKKRSCLLSHQPFLDSDGIIQVGGCLRNYNLPFNQKYPIVLPANSLFLELYVRYLHEYYFHAIKASIVNFTNLH